ncbi:ribonuclease HI family protein [Pisciglobus halotolerans]|uniref:Ribonuclease HI n=1 Tax=Pisciglobus halotolerans TaxID=745365 RepID=A0A1I3BCQ2_9LACT|nr:ribonuclease HI family protein [Pisciglobus halotolerans]SFH59930.1 ribonuclease HI [Pisciglobus halotolerans]
MLKLYTDASTKHNPGPSGVGLLLVGQDLHRQIAIPLQKEYSNHEAEFIAVIKGLEYIIAENLIDSLLYIYSDSKIVVSAIQKNYVKNKSFQPLLQEIRQLLVYFPFYLVEWIPEAQNKGADHLARQALRKKLTEHD